MIYLITLFRRAEVSPRYIQEIRLNAEHPKNYVINPYFIVFNCDLIESIYNVFQGFISVASNAALSRGKETKI